MDIYLLIEGQQQGPYAEDQLRQSLAQGLIQSDLPAWHEGLADWVQIETLLGFSEVLVRNGGEATSDVFISNPADSLDGSNSTDSVGLLSITAPARPKLVIWSKVWIGFVAFLFLGLTIGLGFRHFRFHQKVTSVGEEIAITDAPKISPSSLSVLTPSESSPSFHQEIKAPMLNNSATQPESTTPHENSSTSSEETKEWLKQKIEAFGGYKMTHVSDGGTLTYCYKNVLFDGDVLSFLVTRETESGGYYSFTEKINLAAIKPNSFAIETKDNNYMKSVFLIDPVVEYDIHFEPLNEEKPNYTQDNPQEAPFQFCIKDAPMAKRIVNALNYLCQQTKMEPF